MGYYSTIPLNNDSMSRYAGTRCYGYGTGESHARIIQRAGGEIGYDGFKDPRPNENGNIVASEVFINDKTHTIHGINFSKNGEFCCSYTGMNYQDIKDSNERDCQMKQSQSQSNNNEPRCDEYGVEIREVRSSNQTHTQNNEITRK